MAIVIQSSAITGQSAAPKKQKMPLAESSFLQEVEYDSNTMQATVTMKNGSQHIYFMVYPMEMEQWIQSRSKGEFYNQAIKGKKLGTPTVKKTVGKAISKTHKIIGRPND